MIIPCPALQRWQTIFTAGLHFQKAALVEIVFLQANSTVQDQNPHFYAADLSLACTLLATVFVVGCWG